MQNLTDEQKAAMHAVLDTKLDEQNKSFPAEFKSQYPLSHMYIVAVRRAFSHAALEASMNKETSKATVEEMLEAYSSAISDAIYSFVRTVAKDTEEACTDAFIDTLNLVADKMTMLLDVHFKEDQNAKQLHENSATQGNA